MLLKQSIKKSFNESKFTTNCKSSMHLKLLEKGSNYYKRFSIVNQK